MLRHVQAFFRKLKFQYLEQKANDSYIKIIVNDDAPAIYAADNEVQREMNERKKQELKEKKLRLPISGPTGTLSQYDLASNPIDLTSCIVWISCSIASPN